MPELRVKSGDNTENRENGYLSKSLCKLIKITLPEAFALHSPNISSEASNHSKKHSKC